jgi:hypothetical protein
MTGSLMEEVQYHISVGLFRCHAKFIILFMTSAKYLTKRDGLEISRVQGAKYMTFAKLYKVGPLLK